MWNTKEEINKIFLVGFFFITFKRIKEFFPNISFYSKLKSNYYSLKAILINYMIYDVNQKDILKKKRIKHYIIYNITYT